MRRGLNFDKGVYRLLRGLGNRIRMEDLPKPLNIHTLIKIRNSPFFMGSAGSSQSPSKSNTCALPSDSYSRPNLIVYFLNNNSNDDDAYGGDNTWEGGAKGSRRRLPVAAAELELVLV